MSTTRGIFRRHWHLIFFILGVIVIFWFIYSLRSVLLPFVAGLVLAYLLLPVIFWVERKLPGQGKWQQTKRVSLILLTFIIIFGLVGFLSYFVVTRVVNAFLVLINNAPQYISAGFWALREWAEVFREQLPPEMQQQLDKFLLDAGTALGNFIQGVFARGISFIPPTFSLMLGFGALPIFLFYLLKDLEKLHQGFYSALPPWIAGHTKVIISIIDRVLGRYIRAQLVLGGIVACLCFIGLLILRIDFAPALAIFAGVTELIPILGPWISGVAAVIVALATTPQKAVWVALLFLFVQLFENFLLVPKIQGGYLRIHPAIAIVLVVLGAYIAGFWGLILAVPLTATIVEVYRYVRQIIKAEGVQELPQA